MLLCCAACLVFVMAVPGVGGDSLDILIPAEGLAESSRVVGWRDFGGRLLSIMPQGRDVGLGTSRREQLPTFEKKYGV